MLTHSFTPQAEKDALYDAITMFHQRWEQKRTLTAIFELCDAIDRAEEVCTELERWPVDPQSDLACVKVNLWVLLAIARKAVADVQNETLEEIGQRMAAEERHDSPSPVVPAGTILSCPQCEEGLYKVPVRASINDIVLDDGTILQPLNTTIPQRDAWRALACPKCGGRYYRDGKLHTLQRGWM